MDSNDGESPAPPNQLVGAAAEAEATGEVGDGPEGATEVFATSTLIGEQEDMLMDDVVALKTTSDQDTMYYHEAMQEPDADEFRKAMTSEWGGQMTNGNFLKMKRSEVPEEAKILPSVWQMKRKIDVSMGEVKQCKARLNLDGSRMEHGVDYQLTYAPVAKWNTIRLALIMTILKDWVTAQIDHVLAFRQAPIEKKMCMHLPKGCDMTNKERNEYVLKIKRNVYGQKQAGRVWNKYLSDKLTMK